ncbi:MAG: hypothetical protein JOZ62_20445 [Acidobacteriaceae bacterium]|nr:hypothetical protein [Acidobacteriaceae bacterium]
MLIAIGTLFALHQSGVIPVERTWPLLLIILGLLILLERMVTPKAPYPEPPYGQPPYSQPSAGGPAQ